MEYWSIGVLADRRICHSRYSIAPPLHHSITPRSCELDPLPKDLALLSDGWGDHPCLAGGIVGNRARRIRRHHGSVGFGQINLDEPGWLSRHADLRPIRIEWH